MKDKDYYIRKYNELYKQCWDDILVEYSVEAETTDMGSIVDEHINDIADEDEIVGYYIKIYKDSALEQWLENNKHYIWNKTEQKVTRILERLFMHC